MQTKPRFLLGCKNMSMLAKLIKATNAAAFLPVDGDMLEETEPMEVEESNEERMAGFLEKTLRKPKHFGATGPVATPIIEMDITAQLKAMAENETGMPTLLPTAVMQVKSSMAASDVDVWLELSEFVNFSDEMEVLAAIMKLNDQELLKQEATRWEDLYRSHDGSEALSQYTQPPRYGRYFCEVARRASF